MAVTAMTVIEKPQAKPSGPGTVDPMKQHIVDKQTLHESGGILREGDKKIADRTLCGEDWDLIGRVTGGPMCEECIKVLNARGHGHLLPFIGKKP